MKYKKNKFYNILNKNDNNQDDKFKENFESTKILKKNNKIKYEVKKKNRIVFKIAIIFLVLASICVSLFVYFFGGLKVDGGFDKSDEALGLNGIGKINSSVTNIALFGVDKRKNEKVGRSDSIMIVSFDGIHKEIKIISVLRDSRVLIDGHGKDKLGHAFFYGGANLAVKTLNKNFGLDIRDYLALNFGQMIHIIDAFGGVDVKITRSQVNEINGIINSTKEYKNAQKIKPFNEKERVVHLSGAQALSYARIRKKDDEHHRAARQQIVMDMLLDKLSKMKVTEYPRLLRKLMPFIDTSLGMQDILRFGPFMLKGKPAIKRTIIPNRKDPNLKGGIVNGIWYWQYDVKKYKDILHDFIYKK